MPLWINRIGAPVLVVDQNTLAIRHANECAATFFLHDPDSFSGASIGDIVGGIAELIIAQARPQSRRHDARLGQVTCVGRT